MSNSPAVVTLCATQRLARNLQLAEGRRRAALGETVWPTPAALTVDGWLTRLGEQIALLGEVPPAEVPARVLTSFETSLVWRQVVAADAGTLSIELFDLDSLAQTAAEAHALTIQWHLRIDANASAEETQRFVMWRQAFMDVCRRHDWLDEPRYRQRVCDWIERGSGVLPGHMVFAGFDTLPPQLKRLQAALQERGVALERAAPQLSAARDLQVQACSDAESECRVAAAWAQARLAMNPAVRLGIVVTDLEARRAQLASLLDATLEPERCDSASDALPTRYNISLGLPLRRHALAATALDLLRALGQVQGMAPAALGDLLRLPYWSADISEADLRAQLDARVRERPGQKVTLGTALRLARALAAENCLLVRHLRLLAEAQTECRAARLPSVWATRLRELLPALGWPGERPLSSTEFQARAAFLEVLDSFAVLDEFLGNVRLTTVVSELTRLCAEKIFQPKTTGQPPLQVLGMLEATGAEFDALWVMGMNDDRWPSPPRPNPLLPAELQRRHGTPAASAEVQMVFARKIHTDLLQAAPEIVFSYADKDGERALRPSPLLAGLPVSPASTFERVTERQAGFEYRDDAQAPPVGEGEQVSGGSGLLKAQALCPAWAFYRYRLGAKALQTPADGLDAATRGTLMHAVLEAFWTGVSDLAGLQALRGAALMQAVSVAVEAALGQLETALGEPLTPTLRRLEAERLAKLCGQWLRVEWDVETARGRAPFVVQGCEENHTVTLGRLVIRLVVDRIDVLAADGRRVVIDYKTGGKLNARQWSGERMLEPQLPLYASLVIAEAGSVAAVAFAKLRNGECRFEGVAAAAGLLPGVAALKTLPGQDAAVAWQALLDDWKQKLLALADEVQRGDAAVRFENERDLAYCEVLPLLRIAERRQQFDQSVGGA